MADRAQIREAIGPAAVSHPGPHLRRAPTTIRLTAAGHSAPGR